MATSATTKGDQLEKDRRNQRLKQLEDELRRMRKKVAALLYTTIRTRWLDCLTLNQPCWTHLASVSSTVAVMRSWSSRGLREKDRRNQRLKQLEDELRRMRKKVAAPSLVHGYLASKKHPSSLGPP